MRRPEDCAPCLAELPNRYRAQTALSMLRVPRIRSESDDGIGENERSAVACTAFAPKWGRTAILSVRFPPCQESYCLKRRPAGRNDRLTISLTPVSCDWKNPDRSQKEKTFTSNRGVA